MTPSADPAPTRARSWLTIAFLLLVANAAPALFALLAFGSDTEHWFIWTVRPSASIALLAILYGDALVLAGIGLSARDWLRARGVTLVVAVFSVSATLVTLLHLSPFLAHPWYHLAYWLTIYVLLCILAPWAGVASELRWRREGGHETPVPRSARAWCGALGSAFLAVCVLLLVSGGAGLTGRLWPWSLSPLVARLAGVWYGALAVSLFFGAAGAGARSMSPLLLQTAAVAIALAALPWVLGTTQGDPRRLVFTLFWAGIAGASLAGWWPMRFTRSDSISGREGRSS